MSGTINRNWGVLSLLFLTFSLSASFNAMGAEKTRSIKFTGGAGYGIFFNPYSNAPEYETKIIRPAFSGKLLWEPEYRLSIGVESGYYFIYSTNIKSENNSDEYMTTNLNVIPLFLTLSMKVINHLEVNFATGWASLIYLIKTNDSYENMTIGQLYSMSDFSAGISYYFPINKSVDIGAEIKYLYIGKTDNMHLSGFINISFDIVSWQIKNQQE
jgi:hypothetical protein